MVKEVSVLAEDVAKTLEKENAFERAKQNGGFFKVFKAKDVKEFLDEAWNND